MKKKSAKNRYACSQAKEVVLNLTVNATDRIEQDAAATESEEGREKMRRVLTGKEAKAIDQYTIKTIGIPSVVLMERAALAVAQAVMQEEKKTERIVVVAGCGNNGADALAVARILWQNGWQNLCIVWVGNADNATAEWKMQKHILEQMGIDAMPFRKGCIAAAPAAIDGLFGIGLSRPVEGIFADCIAECNAVIRHIYAVDLSSGIHADTGKILGVCIKAYRTIAFGYEKLGSILYPGAEYSGIVETVEIGFPECAAAAVNPKAVRFEPDDLHRLPVRPAYSNKGTFGKVLIVAGGKNMAGAAYLSAYAAYSVGAGLVRILTVEENRTILQTLLPEAILTVWDEANLQSQAEQCLDWASVVVAGPGLGTEKSAEQLVQVILQQCRKPLVLDADGLNLLAANPQWQNYLGVHCILTPHLGELSRLTGLSIGQLQNRLLETAEELSRRWGSTVVCKDARTIVCAEGKPLYVNISGNQAMAKAGSGDVLTGIVGGILAQKQSCYDAACLGVYLHGLVGDAVQSEKGSYSLLATDLIRALPGLWSK